MIAPHPRNPRVTLAQARRRFECWRRTRRHVSRIPDSLWSLAVGAAREHGVNPTARCLRLDFNHLKRRLATSSPPPGKPAKDSAFRSNGSAARCALPSTAFVELPVPPPVLPPCTIELENAQGIKMRIYLARPETVDLVALSRSFWSVER
jgi:hypothetical protein